MRPQVPFMLVLYAGVFPISSLGQNHVALVSPPIFSFFFKYNNDKAILVISHVFWDQSQKALATR